MSERDRLAELLARATRERRGGDWGSAGGEETEEKTARAEGPEQSEVPGPSEVAELSEVAGLAEAAEPPEVTGGEWLPRASAGAARHREGRGGPRLLTWPESLRSVQLAVRPVAVVGVLVLVVVAGGVFGVRWWLAEQASQPVPVASRGAQQLDPADGQGVAADGDGAAQTGGDARAPSGAADDPGSATTDRDGPTPTAQRLLVHVAGQVREPGVVSLGAGARVQDAVEAAGGLADDADTSRVNLARPVTDGERIWVPQPGEEVPELVEAPVSPGVGGGDAAGTGVGSGAQEGAGSPINLNTADQAMLEELPGVGPVTAAAIIQWRSEHGLFSSPDELLEVSGIGEATLEKLLPHVTL